MNRPSSHLSLLATLFFASVAFAQEDAFVLPQSIFRARVVGVFTQGIDNSYDSQGLRGSILLPFNSPSITAPELAARSAAAGDMSLKTLIDGLNAIQSGMGDNLLSVQVRATGQMNIQQYLAALEYGLTPQLSLGIRLPVVRISANGVNIAAQVQSNAQNIIQSGRGAGYESQLSSIDAQVENTVNAQTRALLAQKGYQLPQDFSVTGLGDMELGGKFQYFNNDLVQAIVQVGLRLPTATHKADQSNLLDRSTGDGQTDIGVRLTQQISPIGNLLLGSSVHFIYQFADTESRYLPRHGESGLAKIDADHLDSEIKRQLGPSVETEISASYGFLRSTLTPSVAYQFNAHGSDVYSGDNANLNYSALQENTNSYEHRFQVGLNYSTIPLYRAKEFAVPLEARISYNTSIGGKNISDNSYFRTDLIVYF